MTKKQRQKELRHVRKDLQAAISSPGMQYEFNNPFKKAMELSLKRVARLLKALVDVR